MNCSFSGAHDAHRRRSVIELNRRTKCLIHLNKLPVSRLQPCAVLCGIAMMKKKKKQNVSVRVCMLGYTSSVTMLHQCIGSASFFFLFYHTHLTEGDADAVAIKVVWKFSVRISILWEVHISTLRPNHWYSERDNGLRWCPASYWDGL